MSDTERDELTMDEARELVAMAEHLEAEGDLTDAQQERLAELWPIYRRQTETVLEWFGDWLADVSGAISDVFEGGQAE